VNDREVRAEGSERKIRASGGLILTGVVLLALVLFVGQNTDEVPVNWLFFEMRQPLWVVIIVAAVAGVVLALVFLPGRTAAAAATEAEPAPVEDDVVVRG